MTSSQILVPFKSLLPSTTNPRKSHDKGALEGLAASILADGLLQNLNVVAEGDELYRIKTGSRRYAALCLLNERGQIDDDYQVPVAVQPANANFARIELVENIQREDLSPMDEADGFAALLKADKKTTAAEIAALIGKSTLYVQRRLALSALSAKVKQAVRNDAIPLSAAQLLTMVNAKGQEAALPSILRSYAQGHYNDAELRRILGGNNPTCADALFDLAAYTGGFSRDLFAGEGAEHFADVAQFRELQEAAITAKVEALRASGAAFVDVTDYFAQWEYNTAPKRQKKGVGVVLVYNERTYKLSVHEGLLKRSASESRSGANNRNKPARPEYSARATGLMAAHRTLALQSELIGRDSIAELLAITSTGLLTGISGCISINAHRAWNTVLGEERSQQVGIGRIEAMAQALIDRIDAAAEGTPIFRHPNDRSPILTLFSLTPFEGPMLYRRLKSLPADVLQDLNAVILVCACGPTSAESHLFQIVADDVRLDIRNHYDPDPAVLGLFTSAQLRAIATETGLAVGGSAKKGELVASLVKHLAREAGTQGRDWLPPPMRAEEGSEAADEADIDDEDDGEAEEFGEDDDEPVALAEAAE